MTTIKGSHSGKKILYLLVCLGILLLCIMPVHGALTDAQQKQIAAIQAGDTITIDESLAELIARMKMQDVATAFAPEGAPDYSSWSDAKVVYNATYYDLTGNKSAYAFDILENSEGAGYILVSATTENYPSLIMTKANLPGPAIPNASYVLQRYAADNSDANYSIVMTEPVYISGTSLYQKYAVRNADGVVKDIYVEDHTGQSGEFDTGGNAPPLSPGDEVKYQKFLAKKTAEIRGDWMNTTNRLIQGTNPSYTVSNGGAHIIGVPFYDWTRGCAPTSSAMMIGFWRDKEGKSSFTSDGPTLINKLADAMKTDTSGSTTVNDISPGIISVGSSYGYTVKVDTLQSVGWDWRTKRVDEGRPFVHSMTEGGKSLNRSSSYGAHAVTVTGYITVDSVNYLYLHDTWTPDEEVMLNDGNWKWAEEDEITTVTSSTTARIMLIPRSPECHFVNRYDNEK